MAERTKKLQRLYKRHLGDPDAEKLILAAVKKHKDKIADLALLEGFPNFADAIDAIHAQYEDRLHMSARSLEISSEELTEALRNVEQLNLNMDAMLNSLGQGLVFFDENGVCSSLCSSAIQNHLGQDPANKAIPDLIGLDGDKKDHFYRWLAVFFAGGVALDFDDLKKLLTTQFVNNRGMIIELDYKPIYLHDDKLIGILLITTDITAEIKARENMAALEQENKKIMAIAMDRNGFQNFIEDLQASLKLLEKLTQPKTSEDDKTPHIRQLHTSKGIAGIYNMDHLVSLLHKAETIIETYGSEHYSAADLAEILNAIHQELDKETETARQIFGQGFLKGEHLKQINTSDLSALKELANETIQEDNAKETIIDYINHHLLSIPVAEAFASFEREIIRLAELKGKPVPAIHIQGDRFPLIYESYKHFFMSLIHIARNIIDHGIESVEDRLRMNKATQPTINVICHLKNGDDKTIEVIIRDDGQGIHSHHIKNKLKDMGQAIPEDYKDEDIINMIFQPSFTMSYNLTLQSGRGYGLSAVKQAVDDLNGNIYVRSTPGEGTAFHISLPYLA